MKGHRGTQTPPRLLHEPLTDADGAPAYTPTFTPGGNLIISGSCTCGDIVQVNYFVARDKSIQSKNQVANLVNQMASRLTQQIKAGHKERRLLHRKVKV